MDRPHKASNLLQGEQGEYHCTAEGAGPADQGRCRGSVQPYLLGSREKFNQMKDVLANLYAGQLCHVILSEEPELYAVGTLELEPAYYRQRNLR